MDQLAIINKALMKCGLPLAAALDDCDWNASAVYDSCAEECLRSFAWNFAQRFENLAGAGKPDCGYNKSYQLPDDCLRVIDVHNKNDLRAPKCRYSVTGRKLYTQATPCWLRYVSRNAAVEDWPPDFADAVACRIACEIAPLSAQTMQIVPQLVNLYQVALQMAQAADARESAERVPLDMNILLARAGLEGVGKQR